MNRETLPHPDEPATRYALLWDDGVPSLDAFLSTAGLLSPTDLANVLRMDQDRRWRAGNRVPVESYLQRLPAEPEVRLDLIYNEYLLREELGDRPTHDEYAVRFPEHALALQDQIAFHRALGGESAGLATMVFETLPYQIDPMTGRPADPEPLPRTFGRYQLLSIVGQGGMGTVYLAHDDKLGRRVALKIPRFGDNPGATAIERFRREAHAAAALDHPQLCPVYDVGQIDGVDYLTMPYIPGEALSDRLKREHRFEPAEAVRLTRSVAGALAATHRAGIIHRDLKPSNILLNDRDEPVVMDFGLARRIGATDATFTGFGAIVGTAAYLPPEQIGCEPEAMGPRCDIYSLGVILYELLTGRVPFRGNVAEVLQKVLGEEPEPPGAIRPDLDPRLQAVCLKAMAKDPTDRYATMDDFAEALGKPPEIPSGRRLLLASVAGAILVSIGIVVWFVGRPWDGTNQQTQSDTPVSPPLVDDQVAVGQKWIGLFQFQPPQSGGGTVALTITARIGETFTGIYETSGGKYKWVAKGVASRGSIRWTLGEHLTDEAKEIWPASTAVIAGTYRSREMTVTYTDNDSIADMTLRLND